MLNRTELQGLVLRKVIGGLWYMTRPERFGALLAARSMLPEAQNDDRWKTSCTSWYYRLVRSIGAVSLLDFRNFARTRHASESPVSSWHNFLPYPDDWGCAVWVEIDPDLVDSGVISPSELLSRWKSTTNQGPIRHGVEAAHIGPLTTSAIKKAFFVRNGDKHLCQVCINR
jgi:hypothetical protein